MLDLKKDQIKNRIKCKKNAITGEKKFFLIWNSYTKKKRLEALSIKKYIFPMKNYLLF